VKELRAKGMSTREIAKEVGIHQKQVMRDLEAEVKTMSSPDPNPPWPMLSRNRNPHRNPRG
jgi:transposase